MLVLRAPPPPRSSSRGISLISVLLAVTVLVVALLGQVSLALSNHRLINDQGLRTHAVSAARQMVARLRSDEDWPGLYDRLRLRELEAVAGGGPYTLPDGGTAWMPTVYYPDFEWPTVLEDFGVVIQVPPATPLSGSPPEVAHLREDLALPAFGLPADLNCDAVIDGESRDTDYRMLPVVVRLRWRTLSGDVQTVRLATWLRGVR